MKQKLYCLYLRIDYIMMESTNFEKELNKALFTLEDINEYFTCEEIEDVNAAYEKLHDEIKSIDKVRDQIVKTMLGEEISIGEVRDWNNNAKQKIQPLKDARKQMKKQLENIKEKETTKRLEVRENYERSRSTKNGTTSPQSVKLQKYTITPFTGDYKDWVRFWNQFEVEIDQSMISEISKLNYLLELTKGKPREDILGLPHTVNGYNEAKRILTSTYGKDVKVHRAIIKDIESLNPITNIRNISAVHEFYNQLSRAVRTLVTMDKVHSAQSTVYTIMDKLGPVREVLAQKDDCWEEWGLEELVENLRKYVERNPLPNEPKKDYSNNRKEKLLNTKQHWKKCAYCESSDHKASDCKNVENISERKKILLTKKLCFNCTGKHHQVSQCKSKKTCINCNQNHHSSICEKSSCKTLGMASSEENAVTYPVVVVLVDGIKCRALLDTGAGSSYASASLLKLLKKTAIRKETKTIEMMMNSTTKKIEVFKVKIENIKKNVAFETELCKVERKELLTLPNPKYADLIKKYSHLTGITMDDTDEKEELPIHIIFGASDYSRIKTLTKPRIGQPGEPVAEYTQLGWTIISPGKESSDISNMMLTRNSTCDHDQLCRLDILGIEDQPTGDQQFVYKEFQEQLLRHPDGYYETGLLWKIGHPALDNNKSGSISRLKNLVRKLKKEPDKLDAYDNIIKEQLSEGIIEKAVEKPDGKEFYIPHKPVIRENAESTKMRIVYDASARSNVTSPSLNDCLETGPALQNLLWSVLIRNRFMPVALLGDIKQAFLQVHIKKDDRDVLRFHWIKDKDPNQIETYRFTRALFGLVQSPFILGGTLQQHLESYKNQYPEEVFQILKSLYVDDIISGGRDKIVVEKLKQLAIKLFGEANFILHKWHSNIPDLEGDTVPEEDQSYAKSQLGVKQHETKILGLTWNKKSDTVSVSFPQFEVEPTKRGILQKLASCYDPLGLAAPIMLVGKTIYRETCELEKSWDQTLPKALLKKWNKWERNLPEQVAAPRAFKLYQEKINAIDFHVFGDASITGTAAVLYAVIHQNSGITQGLVAANARLSKKDLTIPRLELVALHMAANLCENVKEALEGQSTRHFYGWTDSSVALHWVKGKGNYKQFVNNRVNKIRQKDFINWRYVPTNQNPADIGSRGSNADKIPDEWWSGPTWLRNEAEWPDNIVTEPTKETENEAKKIKDILAITVDSNEERDTLLEKYSLWKSLRIKCWVNRFITNCKRSLDERIKGPLATMEIEEQMHLLIQRAQETCETANYFPEHKLRLNLQKNSNNLYECRGRVQGEYPVYIPKESMLAGKIVQDAHLRTIHGGVSMTMAEVRRHYWIPNLRSLVKKARKACYGCKRFQVTAFANPPPGNLPLDRTVGSRAFQVIGVDYAGPIYYKASQRKDAKAYILLFACSLTRAIHLQALQDQSTDEFIRSLKLFIARRGRPQKIYSDNAKTFQAAAKWVKKVVKNEKVHDYLAQHDVKWQFNLSRAPWWGGQFERLIGMTKNAMYKSIGNSNLTWNELVEVLLDIEISMNNRPLCYVEDDVQLPLITPNALIHGISTVNLDEDPDNINEPCLRKRAKYLRKCKDLAWSRWTTEYLKVLRESHNLKHNHKEMEISVGDVVLIKGDEKNRGKWNIGIVRKLNKGRDGVIRSAKLQTGKSILERALQHMYPMELSCQREEDREPKFNLSTPESKPKRNAGVAAKIRVSEVTNYENELPVIE